MYTSGSKTDDGVEGSACCGLAVTVFQEIKLKIVLECLQKLGDIALQNTVNFVWVPGDQGITGNEKSNELARKGMSSYLYWPELFCLSFPICTRNRKQMNCSSLTEANLRSWYGYLHRAP